MAQKNVTYMPMHILQFFSECNVFLSKYAIYVWARVFFGRLQLFKYIKYEWNTFLIWIC